MPNKKKIQLSIVRHKLIKKWVTKYIPTEFDYKEMFTFLDNDTLYGKGGDPNIEPRPDSVKNLLESHPEKLFIWQNVDGTFEKEEDSFYSIYVVDPAHRLLGVISLSKLLSMNININYGY